MKDEWIRIRDRHMHSSGHLAHDPNKDKSEETKVNIFAGIALLLFGAMSFILAQIAETNKRWVSAVLFTVAAWVVLAYGVHILSM